MSNSGQPAPGPNSHWASSRVAIIAELVSSRNDLRRRLLPLASRDRHQQDALSVCVGLALVALKGSDLEVGRLALYRSWGWTLGLGVLLGVGNELLELYVTQPLLTSTIPCSDSC